MIYAIIQARMGSNRCPGKAMLNIKGKPVLWHLIDRIKYSQLIDEIIVATSIEKNNQVIKNFCFKNNIDCFAGSEDDVLDRFYQLGKNFNIEDDDIIIRITADCPLIDPFIVDEVIEKHISEKNDYTSNTLVPSYPDGLDCEVMNFSSLKKDWKNAKLNSEREHVTLYIKNHPELFKLGNLKNNEDLSNLRWTLDEKEDFIFINSVYEKLHDKNSLFLTQDILNLLTKEPELKNINNMHTRNEGLAKSLKKDKAIGNKHDKK